MWNDFGKHGTAGEGGEDIFFCNVAGEDENALLSEKKGFMIAAGRVMWKRRKGL